MINKNQFVHDTDSNEMVMKMKFTFNFPSPAINAAWLQILESINEESLIRKHSKKCSSILSIPSAILDISMINRIKNYFIIGTILKIHLRCESDCSLNLFVK